MTKADLKVGYVVEFRYGGAGIVAECDKGLIIIDHKIEKYFNINDFYGDFGAKFGVDYDIVRVFGFSASPYDALATFTYCRPLLWEREEETQEQTTKSITNLNDLAKDIYENAKAHGWYDDPRTFGDVVALCHSELSEALEEYRNKKPMVYFIDKERGTEETEFTYYDGEKLEGIATEMIDCIIRILDWCGANKIDVENILRLKHEYNKTRPYKHGGKAI